MLKSDDDEYEKAANYLRAGIDVDETATSSDGGRYVRAVSPYGYYDTCEELAGDMVDGFAKPTQGTVGMAENNSSAKATAVPTDPSIIKRLGGKCDYSDKKRCDVQGGLFRCTRCKLAYYCSSDCQNRQWKAGHKKACRTPGQIEVGDDMLIKGVVKKLELNFAVARNLRLIGGSRWSEQQTVSCTRESSSFSTGQVNGRGDGRWGDCVPFVTYRTTNAVFRSSQMSSQ